MTYKWDNPIEWLSEQVDSHGEDSKWLYETLQAILPKLDSDTVQDLFQSDMEADGYFEEESEDSKEDD